MTAEECHDAREEACGSTDQVDGSRRIPAPVVRASDLSSEDRATTEGDAEEGGADAESKARGPSPSGLADEFEDHREHHHVGDAFEPAERDRRPESDRKPHRRQKQSVRDRGDRDREHRATDPHRRAKQRERAQTAEQVDRNECMRGARVDAVAFDHQLLQDRDDHRIWERREHQQDADQHEVEHPPASHGGIAGNRCDLEFVGAHVGGARNMLPVGVETPPPIREHPGGGTL